LTEIPRAGSIKDGCSDRVTLSWKAIQAALLEGVDGLDCKARLLCNLADLKLPPRACDSK
jgi:hypothetical protein